jgi:hypothetical protein
VQGQEARERKDGYAALSPDEPGVTLRAYNTDLTEHVEERVADLAGTIFLSVGEIEGVIEDIAKRKRTPNERARSAQRLAHAHW